MDLGGATRTITVSNAAYLNGAVTNGGLTVAGSSFLQLSSANTYSGNTTISSGKLILTGSINNTPTISIAAGATFDVSSYTTYTLSSSTTLTASGTGTSAGTTAAAVIGGSSGTVALGTRPVTLNYTPTAFTGDSTHQSLYISQGALTVSSPVTVINKAATALGAGTYKIATSAGAMSGSPTLVGVFGTGLASGCKASVSITTPDLLLTVASGATTTTTTLTRHSGTGTSTTYGDSLSFDVAVSPSAATGTVLLMDGSTVIGSGTLSGGSCTITPAVNALAAGTHSAITAAYGGDGTYGTSVSSVLSSQTVAAKALTITAPTVTKVYDGGTTAGTVTVGTLSGFVTGETVTATGTATAYSAKDVGSAYASTVSYTLANGTGGGLAANYSLGNSSITTAAITARPLTFTGSKTYDGSATATAVQLTFGNNMDGANLTMSGSVTLASANAGAPSINSFGGLTLGGSAAGNYTLTGASGSVTISPKVASVTADAKTKTYGDVNPALTAVTNGAVNGDVINVTIATDATQYSAVGTSNITVTAGSNPNYSVTTTGSTLTINPKAASVTADAKIKTYGSANPSLTATVAGTVNGDLLNYTLATDATQCSSVGVSNITVTLGSNPNYSVSATNSTLTINQATTFVGANSTNNPCGYKDAVAFVATLPSDATGSVVFSSTNGPISTNALSGGSATSLSITNLPRGTNVITVTYFGDGNYLGSTNSTLEQIVTNHPPVAKAITNGAPAGVTNVIRLIGGKPHLAPTDADGDALLVSQVQNPSALLSATVTTDGTNILYTPGLNASGADTVQYVVSDGYGGSSTNAMYVTVTGQSFNIISGPTLANNQFQVTFAGIPERAYLVDDSTNSATGPWAFYTNLTAGTNGLFQLVATNDPPAVMRFFRTRPAP